MRSDRSTGLLLTLLFFAVLGGYHVHFMLTAGDWDFWVDWKDRRMWPTVVPILGVTFCAAAQAFFWVNFRLPFGAVFAALGLLIGEWINRYVNFWGWTYFPISLVFPSALIVPAIWLDVILLLSGSYVITAVVGSLGWGLLFYPNNWPAIAAFHQATEQHGQLMSLADLIGFHFVRTSMPEYIRMVERGTLRTFGKDVVPVAAFFSGFVSMMVYFLWWFMGRLYSTTKVIDEDLIAVDERIRDGPEPSSAAGREEGHKTSCGAGQGRQKSMTRSIKRKKLGGC